MVNLPQEKQISKYSDVSTSPPYLVSSPLTWSNEPLVLDDLPQSRPMMYYFMSTYGFLFVFSEGLTPAVVALPLAAGIHMFYGILLVILYAIASNDEEKWVRPADPHCERSILVCTSYKNVIYFFIEEHYQQIAIRRSQPLRPWNIGLSFRVCIHICHRIILPIAKVFPTDYVWYRTRW